MEWETVFVVFAVMLVPISVVGCITFAHVMRPVAERLAELVELQRPALEGDSARKREAWEDALESRVESLGRRLDLQESSRGEIREFSSRLP